MKKNIGFIGIGVMGGPIVLHLLNKGYTVYGYTRTQSKVEKQIDAGMIWCESIDEVTAHTDIIFTMVGFPQDVEDIYLKKGGIIETAKKGAILVDMTTSTPTLAQRIEKEAAAHGIHAVDAPVTGGDLGAINGTLSMMVGGDDHIFAELQPIFEVFTGTLEHMGGAGMGQHSKMANQIAICTNLFGMAESITYCQKIGLDPQKMLNIMGGGSASSWQLVNMGPRALAGDFAPGFYLKHFVKDLKIALDSIAIYDTKLPMLETGYAICKELADNGYGDDGTQTVLHYYEK